MSVKKTLLGDFSNDICECKNFESCFKVYGKYINIIGFEGVAYTCIPKNGLLSESAIRPSLFAHTDPYPTDFLDHYVAEELCTKDYSFRKVMQKDFSPSDFSYDSQQGLLSEKEGELLTLMREDYDMLNALSLSSQSQTSIAAVNIFSSDNNHYFALLKHENFDTLMKFTRIFHSIVFTRFGSLEPFTSPLLQTLKPKEVKILHYLASGKPFKNIEYETGISYGYANNILNKLRGRLGGISRDRLLYLTGLFYIAPPQE